MAYPLAGYREAHGEPPENEELDGQKKSWLPVEPRFFVPDEVLDFFRQAIQRVPPLKPAEQQSENMVKNSQNCPRADVVGLSGFYLLIGQMISRYLMPIRKALLPGLLLEGESTSWR